MIGSMFVGFIIGLIAGAITSRGERMGCIGKILLGWFGSLIGQFLCQEYYGALWLHSKSGNPSQSKPLPPLFLAGFML